MIIGNGYSKIKNVSNRQDLVTKLLHQFLNFVFEITNADIWVIFRFKRRCKMKKILARNRISLKKIKN